MKDFVVMPVLLILGPIFGIAAIAMIVAHAHKAAALPRALTPATHQFELDREMPPEVVHPVLAALTHEQDAVKLELLARELGAKYPIGVGELHAKAAAVRRAASDTNAASAGADPAATLPAAGFPDASEAALVLQAAMRAYAQETDPVSLEGFAESIRPRFPTAAILLLGRAKELRAPARSGITPSSDPIAVSSAFAQASTAIAKSATYAVRAGDSPTVIAERLTRDGKRWPELIFSNPHKPVAQDGSFASLRTGETLIVPASWVTAEAPVAGAGAASKEAQS
jgi:hypothetical protein